MGFEKYYARKEKMTRKQFIRIVIEITLGITIGITLSVLICSISISNGYGNFYRDSLAECNISVFGINIYDIKKAGNEVIGTPNSFAMAILGIIFSLIVVVAIELMSAIKNRNGEKNR
ncbi:MAG: hypothetical protein E7242_00525 [Lachnospiraceae bacterium]|nr:hypothetical protein [Lachnospiraceae bacterium]